MKALWHLNPNLSTVKSTSLPASSGSNLHIRSLYSLISLGTELLVARGNVPEELHEFMRVPYMDGEFIFPLKYGYSLVGEITGTGTLCHLMHPHQSECLIDPEDFFEIPMDIPPRRAILASNLETALTGIWDGVVKPGERIAIVGFGMIGSLIARIAAGIPGTDVKIFETHDSRKAYAEQFGFKVLEDPADAMEPYDIAFHTSGTGVGLQTALDLVGLEGRVIEMSWYGDVSVNVHLGGEFHILRKQLISSQVSRIPVSMLARWDHRRRMKAVFDLLQDAAYDMHITHEVSLQEAAELFNQWRTTVPDGLGYCIVYETGA